MGTKRQPPEETTRDAPIDIRRLHAHARGRHGLCLTVVDGHASIGKMFTLREGEFVIGRSHDVDISLDDESISRRHARLIVKNGEVEIEDLNSRNGTWFNGEAVDRQRLNDGDKVLVGATIILRLSHQDDLDEALQRNLYQSATLDAATGLLNKRALFDALERELAYALRHREPLSVLMVDLDNFKKVNDTHGHVAGDACLSAVSKALLAALRSEDQVARFGGEEFAVLLRGTGAAAAMACAERLRAAVEALTITQHETTFSVTLSIGVTTMGPDNPAPTGEALVERADACLYRAKDLGRNRVVGDEP